MWKEPKSGKTLYFSVLAEEQDQAEPIKSIQSESNPQHKELLALSQKTVSARPA